MKAKYKPKYSADFIKSLMYAKQDFQNHIRNVKITKSFMINLLRSFRSKLGFYRKINHDYWISRYELMIAFAEDLHAQNLRKYESYRNGE